MGTALITGSAVVVTAGVVVVVPVARASALHDAATSTAAVNKVGANLMGGWTSVKSWWFQLLRIR
jgi:hypothetical protein